MLFLCVCFSQSQCGTVSEEPGGARGATGQREEEQVHLNLIINPRTHPETEYIDVLFIYLYIYILGQHSRSKEKNFVCSSKL